MATSGTDTTGTGRARRGAFAAADVLRLVTPPRRRIPPGRLAVGAVVLAACGAAAALMFHHAQHRTAVLAVARPVSAGTTITAADLRVAQLSASGLITLPASESSQVVGRIAAVDLRPGTNLTPDEVTGTAIPPPGQVVVGVLFKPGQLPGRPLTPGDNVQLVTTTGADTAAGSAATPAAGADTDGGSTVGTQREARVVDVTAAAAASDGSQVVDLVVSADAGPGVVEDAAAGRLGLLLLPRAG